MINHRRANIFRFVHHLSFDGTWKVVDSLTNATIFAGLDEAEAVKRALAATKELSEWAADTPGTVPGPLA
ncbi:MAG: hypothetical protein ACOH2L_19655 [Devosia sp.]